jgi:hypothetical protein
MRLTKSLARAALRLALACAAWQMIAAHWMLERLDDV